MSGWKIFFWAMLHRPEFQDCYISSPITLGCRRQKTFCGWQFSVSITFRQPKIHMAYAALDACYEAHGLSVPSDDVPF